MSADPAELAFRELGQGPPVLILHGLLGSGRNWQTVGKQLAARHRVLLVDLRNHGASPWTEAMDYPAMAADLERLLDRLAIGRAAVIGHSMGGKAAMALALLRPLRADRLVAVDVAPVDYGHRVFLDYIRAMQALDLGSLGRRAAVDEALAATVPEPAIRAFLLQNLAVAGGGLSWHPNLATLAREMPAITSFPPALLDRRYDGPTLFLRGERSDYVKDSFLALIRELFPRAELVTVPRAGHWVHAEAPQVVVDELNRFLEP